MQTAGRLVLFGMIVAMLLGAAVLFWRNDFRAGGLFDAYWAETVKSNASYYPEAGGDFNKSGGAEPDQSWSTEAY